MIRLTTTVLTVTTAFAISIAAVPQQKKPPQGFTSLFNGKDLSGWRGRQPNHNPAEEAKLSPEEHKQ